MRIDERNLNDPVSSTAGRAAESQRIQVDSATASASGAAAGGDRVHLSGLAGRISNTMRTLDSQSAQRVSQLQKQYRAGRYQPDTHAMAHALAR